MTAFAQPSQSVGEVFVFVDECHRTQSGKLLRVMKAIMPNAVFIGFTGTPLLKKDKATSMEVFGGYIHTYKFSEAVADEVVLDLIYEARDIDQRLGSEAKIDAWFEAKTKALNVRVARRDHHCPQGQGNRVRGLPRRRGHADPAVRWVHTEMDHRPEN